MYVYASHDNEQTLLYSVSLLFSKKKVHKQVKMLWNVHV